jgi:hypothetical protein
VDDLDVGSVVDALMSIGRHPAIVLSTKEEIQTDEMVRLVCISSNSTISLPEDLIEVPRGLGMKKKCYVQCAKLETVHRNQVSPRNRKAFGVFLNKVLSQVNVAIERAK